MNGIEQQAKAYVSPLPTKAMTDQTNVHCIYKVPDTELKYVICKAINKAFEL